MAGSLPHCKKKTDHELLLEYSMYAHLVQSQSSHVLSGRRVPRDSHFPVCSPLLRLRRSFRECGPISRTTDHTILQLETPPSLGCDTYHLTCRQRCFDMQLADAYGSVGLSTSEVFWSTACLRRAAQRSHRRALQPAFCSQAVHDRTCATVLRRSAVLLCAFFKLEMSLAYASRENHTH